MRLFLIAILLICAACSDDPLGPSFDMRVITTDGENPFDDASFDSLTIEVAQGTSAPVAQTYDIDDDFDVGFVVASLREATRVRVVLQGDTTLHGAPPRFIPSTSGGLVRIPVGAPETCAVIPGFELQPRRGAGIARIDTFVIIAGGEGTSRIDVLDLLRMGAVSSDSDFLDPLPVAGPIVARALSETEVLLVGDEDAFRYDLSRTEERATSITLHAAASSQSVLHHVPGRGTLVAGPGAEFSWVALDGRVTSGVFATERTAPVLTTIGDTVVIVGGNAVGPLVETLNLDLLETTALALEGTAPDSRGLVVGDLVWLLDPSGDSRVLRGCPACRLEEGPAVDRPGQPRGRYLVDGESIAIATDALTFEQVARTSLEGGFVLPYESGVVLHGSGEREGVPSPDIELCFPRELTGIE